ncbi:AIPR family protein [Rhizobium ruizarguesonis]|uniref:AIPR family protein n=1 Tax=Rhizobium ruizarguesonis TaxID=2081791 RepID=UPI0013BDEA1C|nr:AIPR family protein [Rhizobium ruizarguesonis]NEJ64896.1 abortive phage resistance protein [Rhizobium ruizarguesonis]
MIIIEEFEEQWLEDIKANSPNTTQLGNRFAQKILRDWHEIDDATAEVILCDGSGDGGIDAAIFVKADPEEGIEASTWMLVQSKYGTAMGGPDTVMAEAQKLFSTLEGKRTALSSLSTELVTRLRNFLENKGERDRLEYIVATSRTLSSAEREYLGDVRVLGRSKFGDCFDVEAISIETIYNRVCEEQDVGAPQLAVRIKTSASASTEILHIGATTLPDMFAFMQDYKAKSGDLDLLYEKNVRKFLGSKRKVNKGIEETIEKSPERFGLYNNGITIVAEKLVKSNVGELTLINPFIVNGCQTTRSIWSVLQRKLNSGGSAPTDKQREWEERLAQGVVVTKIVLVGDSGEQLLTDTTRYTNSQNAVGEKDFIALEADFRRWGPAFSSHYGVYLEIQRGAWEARRAFQKQNPVAIPQFSESASAFELMKAYAAGWLVEPGIAYGKNPPFAPGGTLFNKIVNEEGFGINALFAAYQLQKLAGAYNFGRGAQKQSRGQTRYLFMMVVIDMIKDCLIHVHIERSNALIVQAVLALAEADLLHHVGNAAVQLIDDYLTDGAEDSIFSEPEFQKTRDLNAFLKSEKLAKSDDFSPNLRSNLALSKKILRRSQETKDINAAIVRACTSQA